jgi:hypothetical protein
MRSSTYNTPVELWQAQQLRQVVGEARRVRVEVQQSGPDGRRKMEF